MKNKKIKEIIKKLKAEISIREKELNILTELYNNTSDKHKQSLLRIEFNQLYVTVKAFYRRITLLKIGGGRET